ncbi:hypothetical protein ACF07V_06765 [Streptomyces sp. NPDC015661]|uniref:hypothetical protein n=1 Tax=Streptomyces sp. NPDC015661 TaxID=3364961 RepID=UPI0036F8F409
MPVLTRRTPDTADDASRSFLADLADLVSRPRSIGVTASATAHSPAIPGGYLRLGRAMGRTDLDRRNSERTSITVRVLRGRRLCLRATTDAVGTVAFRVLAFSILTGAFNLLAGLTPGSETGA